MPLQENMQVCAHTHTCTHTYYFIIFKNAPSQVDVLMYINLASCRAIIFGQVERLHDTNPRWLHFSTGHSKSVVQNFYSI